METPTFGIGCRVTFSKTVGESDIYLFAGITQSRKIRRGVIAFDVGASIPAGSTAVRAAAAARRCASC